MVRPSFVPPPAIRELRELTRYRKTQVDARAREIQRLEKVLQDAGIKLTSVASAVWSVSSREIIEALIAGERDPAVLAQMAKGRMRAKIDQLEEALSGHFGAHHAIVCRQIIDHIDFLDHSIAALTEEVTTRLVPFEAAVADRDLGAGDLEEDRRGDRRRDRRRHEPVPDRRPALRLGRGGTGEL